MEAPMVWIMGGPGSGKGTQAQKIEKQYGFKHIDPVALIESEIASKSSAGNSFAELVSAGSPIPLPQIVPLIEKQLMSHRGALKGFVIDGYPADLKEAEILENGFGTPQLIIALDLDQEAGSTRSSSSPTARPSLPMYIESSKAVLKKYSQATLKIDATQEPDAMFQEIKLNMDKIVQRQPRVEIAR
ncbi:adenylate kinase isoenzyme 1-like [Drosophila teissieri]|uniref:adenylate kinase isoenzyme 1-like n=1 Tax=Drosophila teissieri TaxID=7243 RepID=UPI001CBA4CF6|nr:adenylate kinase isoenzyme 1-like [Drosophila teissieri]